MPFQRGLVSHSFFNSSVCLTYFPLRLMVDFLLFMLGPGLPLPSRATARVALRLLQIGVGRDRQKLGERITRDQPIQNLGGRAKAARAGAAQPGKFLAADLRVKLPGDLAAILQSGSVPDPLPDLRAGPIQGAPGVLRLLWRSASARAAASERPRTCQTGTARPGRVSAAGIMRPPPLEA